MDITRLLEHSTRHMPAGIDRTEYEYAHFLHHQSDIHVTFVFWHPVRGICSIESGFVEKFLTLMDRFWNHSSHCLNHLRLLVATLYVSKTISTSHLNSKKSSAPKKNYYLLLSHHHLTLPHVIARFLQRTNARLVVMIHDLIPILFPEYSGPRERRRHQKRLETITSLNGLVITPSKAVKRDIENYLPGKLTIKAIMHGVQPLCETKQQDTHCTPAPPFKYFTYISTIEPRKNHLLLLNIWREMSLHIPADQMPHLILIGRRGWENENIIDMLDRCPSAQIFVHEYNNLNDKQVTHLLTHSYGLLFPSFAEGFGLPLAEALLANIPAICSDLSVFHEIARDGAFYLNPLDGPKWKEMILRLSHAPKKRTQKELFPNAQKPPLHPWSHQIRQTIQWLQSVP